MRFADSLDEDVGAIKLFLGEVPAFLRERTAAAAQAGDTGARDAYRKAETNALECCVQQLNSMVDGALLILANRTRTDINARDMNRSRATLLEEIETHVGLKLDSLAGWDQVEKIRLDANALKHRVGFTFEQSTEAPLTITDEVNVTEPQVSECLIGAREWLLDIDRRLS